MDEIILIKELRKVRYKLDSILADLYQLYDRSPAVEKKVTRAAHHITGAIALLKKREENP